MNKFIGLLTASVLTANISYASSDMSGFYLGGNLGYGSGSTHLLAKDDENPSDISKFKFGSKGIVGGFHAGFRTMVNKFVVGLEGSASLNKSNRSNMTLNEGTEVTRLSIKRKDSFGVSSHFGPIINNWLVYGKVGYEGAKFSLRAQENSDIKHNTHRLNGFVPGIGCETLLSDNVMLGAEWSYSMYKNKKFEDSKIKARIGDFKLRLSYKF